MYEATLTILSSLAMCLAAGVIGWIVGGWLGSKPTLPPNRPMWTSTPITYRKRRRVRRR